MNYFELISQINWRFLFLIWHVLKSNAYNIRKKLKKVKNYFHFFPGLLTCIYNLRISLIIPGFRSQEMFVFSISQKSLSLAFHPVSPALDASLTPGGAPGWHPALQGIILNLKPASLLLQGFAFPAEQVTQISWDSKAGPVPPAALPCPVPADLGPADADDLPVPCPAYPHFRPVPSVLSSGAPTVILHPVLENEPGVAHRKSSRPVNLSQEPSGHAPLLSTSRALFNASCTTGMLLAKGICLCCLLACSCFPDM